MKLKLKAGLLRLATSKKLDGDDELILDQIIPIMDITLTKKASDGAEFLEEINNVLDLERKKVLLKAYAGMLENFQFSKFDISDQAISKKFADMFGGEQSEVNRENISSQARRRRFSKRPWDTALGPPIGWRFTFGIDCQHYPRTLLTASG